MELSIETHFSMKIPLSKAMIKTLFTVALYDGLSMGREVKTKELNIESVESILFEKHIDGNIIINYFKTLENREIAHLSIPRRNIIKLDKLANGMKVGTWFE